MIIPKKRNLKPEKQVEKEILAWCNLNGFDMSVIDSKAAYSPRAGMYLKRNRMTSECMPDLVGNYNDVAVFIELKAPGRRKNLSLEQWMFLKRKIDVGCFACVTDGAAHLTELFKRVYRIDRPFHVMDKNALLSDLPNPK